MIIDYSIDMNATQKQENAMEHIVRNVLRDINNGQDVESAIAMADCSELDGRVRHAWLVPARDYTGEEITGFTVYLGHYTEDEDKLNNYYLGSVAFG